MSSLNRVIVFVDWDSAFRIVPGDKRKPRRDSRRDILRAIELLSSEVARFLNRESGRAHYRVLWRMYHGWYMGKTKTKERMAFEEAVRGYSSRRIGAVAFGNDFRFGDELLCDTRRSPLFDTLRSDPVPGRAQVQKMVDTALVCDLLHAVRFGHADVSIVIGEDDDLLPGIFTAEAWQGSVAMLHRRPATNRFLNTSGLLFSMELS